MSLADLGKEKYVSLETFRKNGQGVKTPVWVIGKDGQLYVWTQADSWKVKRIRQNGQVKVAKSDGRGNVEGEWISAQAHVLDDPADEKKMRQQLAAKYGLFFRLFQLMGRFRTGGGNRVVIEIREA